MTAYQPGPFVSVFQDPKGYGPKIWDELLEHTREMVALSAAGRPAVEAVAEHLLRMFGEYILDDRVKQMTGHMIRQIMESAGLRFEQANVKTNTFPFTRAARYAHPDRFAMQVFRNAADHADVIIVNTRQPVGLPASTNWVFYSTISTALQAWVGFGVRIQDVEAAIAKSGFLRTRVGRLLRAG